MCVSVCVCVCFLLISAPVPLCPGLFSSPTVCAFIHRKCRGALRVAGLMRSDVASPASRELSMSGRSARGKQTVDKIFNTALPVHGSNTSEKTHLQNPKEKKNIIISPTSSLHSGGLGGFINSGCKSLLRKKSRVAKLEYIHLYRMTYGFSTPPLPQFREGMLALLKVQKCILTFFSLGADTGTQ